MLLDILKSHHIPLSWSTIFVGKKLNLVHNACIEAFATQYLSDNPKANNVQIIDLAYGFPDTYVGNRAQDETLQKIFTSLNISLEKDSPEWKLEERKWRYALLKKVQEQHLNSQRLLEEIESIYCTFDHPEDMADFEQYIPYMPPTGLTTPKSLATILDEFLKKEQHELVQEIDA